MSDGHEISRRGFLAQAGGALLGASAAPIRAAPAPREKPPFRVLYSNDLTNILSCISPFHQAREPFRKEMLEATVDEVSGRGVDVHLLQPGLGSVPLWPSKVYPVAEHEIWLRERYGLKLDPFAQFVRDGGDVVQVFIDRCRQRGQAPFLSFRLNDAHHKEFADAKKGDKIPGSAAMGLSKFYSEHPEYRIGSESKSASQVVMNWAIPEVRANKLALIGELCANYDFDGLELDFLRFYSLFQPDKTSRAGRCGIITEFIRQVRDVLDRGTRGGRHRWLSARVPCYLPTLDLLGIDLRAMVAAGLDVVNASAHYFTTQHHDLAAIRRQVPEAALYLEMCHSTWNGPKLEEGYDVSPFRRTTREQYYTTAHQAYARGADGVSAFNFAYYREFGGAGRGPFHEPPFEIFKGVRDPAWLARQPQHWFLAPGWRAPGTKPTPVPRQIAPGVVAKFVLDLAAPEGGWKAGGRLRLQAERSLGESQWRAVLNGTELTATPDVSEPFPNPYPGMLGKPEELRAWVVPAAALLDGRNEAALTLIDGAAANAVYLDLALGCG